MEDGLFTWVGQEGARTAPEGADRVDLRGKTVIPALIDAHQHIGLTNVKSGTTGQEQYTRANLIEHLDRFAYHGVAATMSLGLETDEGLAFAAPVPRFSRYAYASSSSESSHTLRGFTGVDAMAPTKN